MYAKCLMMLEHLRTAARTSAAQGQSSQGVQDISAISAQVEKGKENDGEQEEEKEEEEDDPRGVAKEALDRARNALHRSKTQPARLADVMELLGRLALAAKPGEKWGGRYGIRGPVAPRKLILPAGLV